MSLRYELFLSLPSAFGADSPQLDVQFPFFSSLQGTRVLATPIFLVIVSSFNFAHSLSSFVHFSSRSCRDFFVHPPLVPFLVLRWTSSCGLLFPFRVSALPKTFLPLSSPLASVRPPAFHFRRFLSSPLFLWRAHPPGPPSIFDLPRAPPPCRTRSCSPVFLHPLSGTQTVQNPHFLICA